MDVNDHSKLVEEKRREKRYSTSKLAQKKKQVRSPQKKQYRFHGEATAMLHALACAEMLSGCKSCSWSRT